MDSRILLLCSLNAGQKLRLPFNRFHDRRAPPSPALGGSARICQVENENKIRILPETPIDYQYQAICGTAMLGMVVLSNPLRSMSAEVATQFRLVFLDVKSSDMSKYELRPDSEVPGGLRRRLQGAPADCVAQPC